MAKISTPLKLLGRGRRPARVEESAILLALASPVLVVDADNQIVYVNDATEQFFRLSANQLVDQRLADFIPDDSPLFSLLSQVRAHGNSMSDHGVTLETPRIGTRDVTIEVAPIADGSHVDHPRGVQMPRDLRRGSSIFDDEPGA